MLKLMKNQKQPQQKSIYSSITGTSTHKIFSKRNQVEVKRYENNNQSEKSFQKHMLSGVRHSISSNRQKIIPSRYATLTAGQEVKKRPTKKSKSFSNQIYFPHGNFATIYQTNELKPKKNIIRLKSKTQNGNDQQLNSVNVRHLYKNQTKNTIIITHSQKQNKQEEQMSFLSRLNLEKRSKIMQIYRPKPQMAKSRKTKQALTIKTQANAQNSHLNKNSAQQKQSISQKQFFPASKLTAVFKKQNPKSKSSKNIEYSLQKSSNRPLPITHVIIQDQKQSSNQNIIKLSKINETNHLVKTNKTQNDKSSSIKIQKVKSINFTQNKTPQQRQTLSKGAKQSVSKDFDDKIFEVEKSQFVVCQKQHKFPLPKYTNFYDNYISHKEMAFKSKGDQLQNISHDTIKRQIPVQLDKIMSKGYSPIITCAKATSITPKILQQLSPNRAQSQLFQSDEDFQNRQIQGLKANFLIQKGYTPKLKNLNQLFTINSIAQNEKFNIIKIGQGNYVGQINPQNKPNGLGVIFYKSGKLFEGEFNEGIKNGQGYELYPDSSFFLGHFKDNKKNGKGRFQWSNGQIYDGQWLDDKKHGSGQWKAEGKISYVGQWKNNKIQGFGVLMEGEQRYQGQFANFTKYGHGTYRYENGQIYTGKFKNNRLNGQGQYFWPNGDHYKGYFVNNKRHGQGNLFLSSSNILYRGQFRNDKKCGLGEQVYGNEIKYIGNFQNDLKHGWGILKRMNPLDYEKQEIVYQGYWINNQTIQMSQTPIEEFNMIEEDQAEYLKNQLSRSNIKAPSKSRKNQISPQRSQKTKKHPLEPKSKPKESVTLKGRSRYMRINNHYIKKSIQGSNVSLHQNSAQKLEKSRSPKDIPHAK